MNRRSLLSLLTTATLGTLTAAPVCAEPSIEVLAELSQRPGNPAVMPDGTVYISMHPFDGPEFKIQRLEDGRAVPYPNPEVSKSFAAVIGIQATNSGELWWLDMGSEDISPKLVGWDTEADRLKAVHVIPREASVANSFHQDFAIDEKGGRAFIADMSRGGMIDESNPAIVVVDLKTGATRRVLSGHSAFQPSKKTMLAEGKPMQLTGDDGKAHDIKLGLNPIAIDPANEWIYFAAMTPGHLYRVPVKTLGDFSKSDAEIESSIEVYGQKPSSDGIAVGDGGRVYITNVDENAITIVDANGTRNWIEDESLIWTDGVYVAPDKSLVVTINQLNRAAAFNGGKSGAVKPYQVVRVKP